MILPSLIGFITPGPSGAPPTFSMVDSAETSAWNTTDDDKVTGSFDVQTGDMLVAVGVSEDHGTELTIATTGITWTLQEDVNVNSHSRVFMWTATAGSTTSLTTTFSRGSVRNFGGAVLVFRGPTTVGAAEQTTGTEGPALSITSTSANSMIVCAIGDWNAIDGSSRTWRTVNSLVGSEGVYAFNSGLYTAYVGYWLDAGAVGAKTVGLSAPTGQKYSIAAVELF